MDHVHCRSDDEFRRFLAECDDLDETRIAAIAAEQESLVRIKRELMHVDQMNDDQLSPHQLLYVNLGREEYQYEKLENHADLVVAAFKRDPIGLGVVIMHADDMAELCCCLVNYDGRFLFSVANNEITPTKERLIEAAKKQRSVRRKLAANLLIWMIYNDASWY